jgi:hypothetical protein
MSAFATNITDVGSQVNKYVEAVIDLSYLLCKTNTEYSDKKIQYIVDAKVNEMLGFMGKSDLTINNIDAFSQELVNVTSNVISRVKSDYRDGTDKNFQLDKNASVASSSEIASIALRGVLTTFLDFLDDCGKYTENSYKDFTSELTNKKVLDTEKQELFKTLKKLSKKQLLKSTVKPVSLGTRGSHTILGELV